MHENDKQEFAVKRARVLKLTYKEGMGERAVARALKKARKTVAKVVRGAEPDEGRFLP